jgi:large subunit ribosomal protein L9
VEANSTALNELKNREESKAHHLAEEKKAAEDIAKIIDKKSVTITAKAGGSGKLFGSVTAKEIAAAVKATFNVEIDRRKMNVADIKQFGEYTAEIKLYSGVSATLTVIVKE